MHLRVSKDSPVPLHEQISGQLVFLIATRKLLPGETLPSIRTLARTLKVHHNTVSEAMQYLIKWNLIVRRRGARLTVNDPAKSQASAHPELADLVNDFVQAAQAHGYTEPDILHQVRNRLLAEPPHHILAISYDAGMRRLFEHELRAHFSCPIDSCSPDELIATPDRALGALVLTPPGVLPRIAGSLPKTRPPLPALYSDAAPFLDAIRELKRPSVLLLASISEAFLEVARGVLGPVTNAGHPLLEYRLPEKGPLRAPPADLILCDQVAARQLARTSRTRLLAYSLLAPECLQNIAHRLEACPK
ncbi:MAG: hypothetical protein RL328_2601 [Acidobacteriota bacterium]